MNRIEREKRVVGQMIAIYCRRHHRTEAAAGLCSECAALLSFACRRIEHCPKGEAKTSCRKCDIHCYPAAYRERIRAVMRYSGPRMLLVAPLAAVRHLIDEMRR